MQRILIHRYIRPDGGVTVSPEKPETDYTELTRLVAEQGRTLTDGTSETACVDTDAPDIWEEVLPDSEAQGGRLPGEGGDPNQLGRHRQAGGSGPLGYR